jgi:hypothetical protein
MLNNFRFVNYGKIESFVHHTFSTKDDIFGIKIFRGNRAVKGRKYIWDTFQRMTVKSIFTKCVLTSGGTIRALHACKRGPIGRVQNLEP